MARFRWMSPIFVGLTSSPGIRDRAGKEYQDVLCQLCSYLSGYSAFSPRSRAGSEPFGWATASGAAQPWPLEVLQGKADESNFVFPVEEKFQLTTPINWYLYDYGVFLVDGYVDVEDSLLSDPELLEDRLREYLGQVTVNCGKCLLSQVREFAKDVKDWDYYFHDEGDIIDEPLWVTRAFQMDLDDPVSCEFGHSWVKEVDEEHNQDFKKVLQNKDIQVARWMNHVHNVANQDELDMRWESLKIAQFFWASLQRVDESLRVILAESMADSDEIDLRSIRWNLNFTVNSTVELFMVQDEYRQYAPRRTKKKVTEFLQVWEYESDLRVPAQRKLELCQDRISKLSAEQQERSAVTTDIILLGIGLTSLLATAVALVQFGRDANSDPKQSMFDLGNGSITSWLSSQSMDSVLLISLLASVILMLLFFWKRRQAL